MRTTLLFPVIAFPILLSGISTAQDPATFTVDKHATYTAATDGWPYAFLPDGDGYYLMVGGMTRAPRAFRYDSTGHKGSPRMGIDLSRRATDISTWRMENGRIFNVVFSPPLEAEGEGEIIWGSVDPLKPEPAEGHPIGTIANTDKTAPLAWINSAMKVDGHHAVWIVPHMKKKECASLAVAIVDWITGEFRIQEVSLPKAVEGLKVLHMAANEGGDLLISMLGMDPLLKKDAIASAVPMLLGIKADGTTVFHSMQVTGYTAGCTACRFEPSGQVRCAGFAVNADRSTPAIIHSRFPANSSQGVQWATEDMDAERARQLADRARLPKEMEDRKPEKFDAKAHSQALGEVLVRLAPIHLELLEGDSLLFVAEVQVRNEFLGDPTSGTQAGNLRDQLVYAKIPATGQARIGVVRKYIVEEGAPGFGDVARTLVMAHQGKLYFFFNDWEKHAFAAGATPTDRFARINVATVEGAGVFDPMVHVEGANGPIERTAIQRSTQLDFMMNGCSIRGADGSMLIALTKSRSIQWMKVVALP